MNVSTNDLILLFIGFVVGTFVSYLVGRAFFAQFFKKQVGAITFERTAKFELIQQTINYLLGFALAYLSTVSIVFLPLAAAWFALETWLAIKIFTFKPKHALAFAFVDTLADIGTGVVFGTGAATLTLVRMTFFGA